MTPPDPENAARARMPADVDAPDKVLYGLTFRQLAILAVAAVVFAAGWHLLHHARPAGRACRCRGPAGRGRVRDRGRPPRRTPVRRVAHPRHPIPTRTPRPIHQPTPPRRLPPWVTPPTDRVPLPAPLRLPADAIDDDGTITLTNTTTAGAGDRVAIVAATTVNLTLRTPAEQAALLDTFGRWLNSLTDPTQIVIANQPVDLQSAADTLTTRATHLPQPGVGGGVRRPRRRSSPSSPTAATHCAGKSSSPPAASGPDPHAARRHAEHTARTLTALGLSARTLDAAAATTALAGCADPYRTPRPGGQAPPHATITAPAVGSRVSQSGGQP